MASPLGANVFITGANRGIGLGLVHEILKVGGVKHLFAGCRNPEGAKDLQQLRDSNKAVKIVQIDVGSDESITRAADEIGRIVADEGGLNLLINNSGILEKEGCTPQHPDRQVFMRHFDVNTVGAAVTTAAFLPLLRKAASSGQIARVVNISSILGCISQMIPLSMVPNKNVVYGMSKAALNHFTKALSMDEPDIVTVAIHPGWVKTDMGGPNAPVAIEDSVKGIVKRICGLTKEESGKLLDYEKELQP